MNLLISKQHTSHLVRFCAAHFDADQRTAYLAANHMIVAAAAFRQIKVKITLRSDS